MSRDTKKEKRPRFRDLRVLPYLAIGLYTALLIFISSSNTEDWRIIAYVVFMGWLGAFMLIGFTVIGLMGYDINRRYFDHPQSHEYLLYKAYRIESEIRRAWQARKQRKLRRREQKAEMKYLFGK